VQKRIKKQQKANNFTPIFSKSVEKSQKIAKKVRFPTLRINHLTTYQHSTYTFFPSQSQKTGCPIAPSPPSKSAQKQALFRKTSPPHPHFSPETALLILPASKAVILSASKAAIFSPKTALRDLICL
jgi:hypothetical protein